MFELGFYFAMRAMIQRWIVARVSATRDDDVRLSMFGVCRCWTSCQWRNAHDLEWPQRVLVVISSQSVDVLLFGEEDRVVIGSQVFSLAGESGRDEHGKQELTSRASWQAER